MHFNRYKIRPSYNKSSSVRISKKGKAKPIKTNKHKLVETTKSKKFISSNSKKSIRGGTKNSFNKRSYLPLDKWKNLLEGETAFILGNGPSLKDQPLHLLDNYFTIGINRIFYLYNPTILLWQDLNLWRSDKKNILSSNSIKVCRDHADPQHHFMNFSLKMNPSKFNYTPNLLHGRGSSSMITSEFAVSLGCSSIVFLGVDCQYEGTNTDFYGINKDHKKHTLKLCKNTMKWVFEKCPIPIYNCGDVSYWPKLKLEDVLSRLNPKKHSREYFDNLFKKGK